MPTIEIVDFRPGWAGEFERIAAELRTVLSAAEVVFGPIDHIACGQTGEQIVVTAAGQQVGTKTAIDRVIAGVAKDGVVACLAQK